MDRIIQVLKQYRYGVLVLIIGLGLMLLPDADHSEEESYPEETVQSMHMQDQLEHILSQIEGAGKVSVLLTEAEGETRIYQRDTDSSGESSREDTILITDAQRSETGLVRQVIPATYQGAVVVCQGADRASVRLAIVKAVSDVTGLTSDKISVWKMK